MPGRDGPAFLFANCEGLPHVLIINCFKIYLMNFVVALVPLA